jgi:hypothetical protein
MKSAQSAQMPVALQKFATQADPDVLDEVRAIAAKEGRQFQSIIDEALRDFIEKRKRGVPRPEVLTALGESLAEYEVLYKKLAK